MPIKQEEVNNLNNMSSREFFDVMRRASEDVITYHGSAWHPKECCCKFITNDEAMSNARKGKKR